MSIHFNSYPFYFFSIALTILSTATREKANHKHVDIFTHDSKSFGLGRNISNITAGSNIPIVIINDINIPY
jgi:hypothetical protein